MIELRALAEEREKGELERAMALRYRRVKFFGRGRVWVGGRDGGRLSGGHTVFPFLFLRDLSQFFRSTHAAPLYVTGLSGSLTCIAYNLVVEVLYQILLKNNKNKTIIFSSSYINEASVPKSNS